MEGWEIRWIGEGWIQDKLRVNGLYYHEEEDKGEYSYLGRSCYSHKGKRWDHMMRGGGRRNLLRRDS